jgi:maltose O-acetyltransferase
MFRKILNTIYLRIYENGKKLSQLNKYNLFREKYSIDKSFRFNGNNILFYGKGLIICGEDPYIGELSTIQSFDNCKVEIGKNCSISHNVRIYTQSRIPDQDFSKTKDLKTGDVIIKDNVWIGANVFINPSITIGENAVIGANSVITKDVESFTIVGGVPAKIIRKKKINNA